MLLLNDEVNNVLLEKRPPTGIWGGLWSFPEHQETETLTNKFRHFQIKKTGQGETIRHTFSHFHLDITPIYAKVINEKDCGVMDGNHFVWYNGQQLKTVGIAAPIKKLLDQYHTQLENHNGTNRTLRKTG